MSATPRPENAKYLRDILIKSPLSSHPKDHSHGKDFRSCCACVTSYSRALWMRMRPCSIMKRSSQAFNKANIKHDKSEVITRARQQQSFAGSLPPPSSRDVFVIQFRVVIIRGCFYLCPWERFCATVVVAVAFSTAGPQTAKMDLGRSGGGGGDSLPQMPIAIDSYCAREELLKMESAN